MSRNSPLDWITRPRSAPSRFQSPLARSLMSVALLKVPRSAVSVTGPAAFNAVNQSLDVPRHSGGAASVRTIPHCYQVVPYLHHENYLTRYQIDIIMLFTANTPCGVRGTTGRYQPRRITMFQLTNLSSASLRTHIEVLKEALGTMGSALDAFKMIAQIDQGEHVAECVAFFKSNRESLADELCKTLTKFNIPQEEIDAFRAEVMAGNCVDFHLVVTNESTH